MSDLKDTSISKYQNVKCYTETEQFLKAQCIFEAQRATKAEEISSNHIKETTWHVREVELYYVQNHFLQTENEYLKKQLESLQKSYGILSKNYESVKNHNSSLFNELEVMYKVENPKINDNTEHKNGK